MGKKAGLVLAAGMFLGIAAVGGFGCGVGKPYGKNKPFRDLDASQIASASVQFMPPDETIPISDVEELVRYLADIVVYNKDNSYTGYAGQSVTFTLTMTDGSQTRIMEYSPFLVIDGTGYRAEYGPCEALRDYVNGL